MTRILQVPNLTRIGRFGNHLNFYAIAKHYADECGAVLQTCDWVGRRIFELDSGPIEGSPARQVGFPFEGLWDGIAEFNFSERISYPVLYSQEDFKRYFKLPAHFEDMFAHVEIAIHWRRGDFLHSNCWPHLGLDTLRRGCEAQGLDFSKALVLTEESPQWVEGLPTGEPFVCDFLMMCFAKHLFVYPSSSFSGMAAVLNENNVYFPEGYTNGPTGCEWRKRA